jgi:pimeloyl-ACP methyl ester carboxylesterase
MKEVRARHKAGVLLAVSGLLSGVSLVQAQPQAQAPAQLGSSGELTGLAVKTTFVPLGALANAVLVEPVTPNAKSRIAVLVTHPERINNLSYFVGQELPKYGYRAMLLNYYGKEISYYEFLQPVAAAIKALRALPGVEKVVLAGHSSGGAELTSYEDVAENGPAACQGAERIYKCQGSGFSGLPKADGIMMVEANTGSPEKTLALNPAVNDNHPRQVDPTLDLYDPRNGYDAATRKATYSKEFLDRFFKAQGTKANRVIDAAMDRLAKIEAGQGEYRDDEPFVVAGAGVNISGARADFADSHLMSRTHAPHPLLKTDGSVKVQIVPKQELARAYQAQPYEDMLAQTTMNVTVRHYLSTQALRLTPDYRVTEDNVLGVQWRSTPNSMQGNVEGIRVPTLFLAATCSQELVLLEIGYDHSAAKDKEFVGVEGADHGYHPCKPEYGNTYKRAFDYMDSWLSKPGRFSAQ